MEAKELFSITVLEQIKERLTALGQTIAVAESVTAGFLQGALASAEEASGFFQGGMTVYNIGQKCRHLDINPIHAMDCNCVSEKMAKDMAVSVAKLFTAHWGIGITGYATPVPESGDELFAYAAIAFQGEVRFSARIDAGDKLALDAQLLYVNTVLSALQKEVEQR